jgi:hypothetical protein
MPASDKALEALLDGLIDYAGLFPPAAHNMAETVGRHAGYRLGPDAAALGRLVVPAARLMEWEQAVAALPPARRGTSMWHLTALASLPASRDLQAVTAFNARESSAHDFQARVDSVEVKVTSPDDIRRVAGEVPSGVEVFYEHTAGEGLVSLLPEVARAGGGVKLRTGGLVPAAIAPPQAVAAFVDACVAAEVPFKATGGLHHAVRASHPLTYEADAPRTVVNGFLNVFVAAILAHAHRLRAADLVPILEEVSPAAFSFDDSQVAWRGLSASAERVAAARRLARSFGSCSFEEPIADLKALGVYR